MSIEVKAICISTVHCDNLGVLISSINNYVPPGIEIYIGYCDKMQTNFREGKKYIEFPSNAKNYGDAYNLVVKRAFEKHEYVIVCNDDVVFTPTTYSELLGDYNQIAGEIGVENIGWLGCLTDYAIGMQNIRRNVKLVENQPDETIGNIQNYRENDIIETNFIAPICGIISKQSWVDYLPINYFSDNLQCYEMQNNGKRHFISTAYVHHVGSQSLEHPLIEKRKALDVLQADYPQYYKILQD